MGFFKDFKEDFSQAVNELMPGEDNLETENGQDELVVNTLEGEVDVESELSKLDGLLEQVTRQEAVKEIKTEPVVSEPAVSVLSQAASAVSQKAAPVVNQNIAAVNQSIPSMSQTAPVSPAPAINQAASIMPEMIVNQTRTIQEERAMADNTATPVMNEEKIISDEVSIITEGTIIKGDIVSNGSIDVRGQVEGNVGCNGKLVVTGVINGNSNSSEFFADAAKIEGEVVSTGTVKIGLGSVIIGNVTSTSAVIAGAIKGDIDVQGPVVVDTSAVVMGNIKSRSVQINNGAVIEGFCSQSYADVDVKGLFDVKKGNE